MSYSIEEWAKDDEKLLKEFSKDNSLDTEKALGFKIKPASCFIAPSPCSCNTSHVTSLIPLYDMVFLPVYSKYFKKNEDNSKTVVKINSKSFENFHGLTVNELKLLAQEGRVIPYFFDDTYRNYDPEIIQPLLNSGVPTISPAQRELLVYAYINQLRNQNNWNEMSGLAKEDIVRFNFKPTCNTCLTASYLMGFRKHLMSSPTPHIGDACFFRNTLAVNQLNSVLQTECSVNKGILSQIGGLPEKMPIDYILEGLKVNYCPEIPIERYIEIFDSKTTKAIRRTMENLLSDPYCRKYPAYLKNKVFDLNQQVTELADGRAAKVFETVSEMAIYSGQKYLEAQSSKMIKIPKKGLITIGEWLASRGIDFQTRVSKKDWSVAQIYKARCKLGNC